MSEFPKTMKHPHHVPASIGVMAISEGGAPNNVQAQEGRPERFPPIDVMTAAQEAYYLAKGYLSAGAAVPGKSDFAEWPKMLTHPQHVPAKPATMDAKLNDQGKLVEFAVAGTPEQFPHIQVNNETEQKRWEAKGYRATSAPDPEAYAKTFAAPFDPNYEVKHYPMMVDGVVVNDPNGPGSFQEYPKWIGGEAGEAVGSVAEEVAARERLGLPAMEARAQPVEVDEPQAGMIANPALDAMLARAAALGVDVQEGWGPDEIMDAMLNAYPVKNKGGRPRKAPLQPSD